MPRVLFVSTSTTLGGAEKTLFTLATRLRGRDCETAGVVGIKPPGHYAQRLTKEGIKTWSLDLVGWPSPSHAAALERIIREAKPDIVHALMYQAIQLCRFVKRRSDVPFRLVSSPRVNYRSRSRASLLLDRWLRREDDLLISESEASRAFLLSLGYAPERVRTVRNGVDLPELPSAAERKRARLQLGLREDEPLLLSMGRLDEQKGHSVLLDAAARLQAQNRPRCAVVGDGPLRDRLRRQAVRLGLERSVQLPGERADVRAWMHAADVFVLPSLWEGLPNALLEAMALGLPTVASRVDGVPEAVTDGIEGVLVKPEDPAALAAALDSLLADAALRRRLGEAGRARVAKEFTVPAMLSGTQACYREVLAPGA